MVVLPEWYSITLFHPKQCFLSIPLHKQKPMIKKQNNMICFVFSTSVLPYTILLFYAANITEFYESIPSGASILPI